MQKIVTAYNQHNTESQVPSPDQIASMTAILQQAKNAPSWQYFIHQSILTKNLYGVDLMPEAVEVCKLSLTLKLLAQVRVGNPAQWAGGETFSSADLNVHEGNTLLQNDHWWSNTFPSVPHGRFRVIVGLMLPAKSTRTTESTPQRARQLARFA